MNGELYKHITSLAFTLTRSVWRVTVILFVMDRNVINVNSSLDSMCIIERSEERKHLRLLEKKFAIEENHCKQIHSLYRKMSN